MVYDKFVIAPFNDGLQKDLRPWLISDDAFAELNNAYVFRGRVRKRFGSELMNTTVSSAVAPLYSRLRIALTGGAGVGATDGAGAATGTVPGAIFKIGQQFSIGTEIFTVTALGTPSVMLTTGASTTMTYNTTTGVYVFAGATPTTQIYFYPAEPVMGITTYELAAINDEQTVAFDTQFAYYYDGTGWERLGTATWTGNDAQFFWANNYRGANDYDYILFATNFNAGEMYYWNGAAWTNFIPRYLTTGELVRTARIIVPFKDRLLLLNTVEQVGGVDRSFPNRCRYSQNGDPTNLNNSFNQTLQQGADHIDAATKEAIISARILKDRLIVFFERSTYELVYTGNDIDPFRWQKLNEELGCESTFSMVPFDKVMLGVGNVGIHACNGVNVERIDQSIPDEVFDIHNLNDGVYRVHGIRDYRTEMVYWTLPSGNVTYPNKVLVFNYKNGSWSFNDDSFTAFGYYQNANDKTWAMMEKTWEETIEVWNSGYLQAKFRQTVAGNQQGYVFLLSPDSSRNAPSLQITNITNVGSTITITSIDHNLSIGDFVLIEQSQGITALNNKIYQINNITSDTIEIVDAAITGTYTGGGTLARVSRIDFKTKQYNFYVKQGKNALIGKVDCYVDKTVNGEITVESYASSSSVDLGAASIATGTNMGTNVLETAPYTAASLENSQSRLWHPVYLFAEGEVVQLRFYLADDQLSDLDIATSDFQLNGLVFYSMPVSRLQ